MVVRPFILSAISFGFLAAVPAAIVRADDTADVENAKHNFIGAINGSSVFVRSAPREDAYPAMKLDKGAQVTVVGIKFKWLKILPPEGSFAYVPKAYVNKRGDGKVGRATREVIAKVGSSLNQLKTAPMGKVDESQDVEIVGEQDEYYKIKPPAGTFLYVNESFVDPLKALPTPPERREKEQAPPIIAHNTGPKILTPPARPPTPPVTPNEEVPKGPLKTETPQPSQPPAAGAPTEVATAAPTPDSFEKLEADFKAANEKPITDQPVDALLTGYTELLKQETLLPRTRQVAEVRVSTLKLRSQAKAEFIAAREEQRLAADRQKALVAERQEIQQRIKEQEVTFYAAVGTLRASSIQRGNGTLFRLTDPATGRTIAYLRTSDAKYASMLGQFVGVKGIVTTDSALNMKIIEGPTATEAVDPAKVNASVAAQIIPPSLVPGLHARTPTD